MKPMKIMWQRREIMLLIDDAAVIRKTIIANYRVKVGTYLSDCMFSHRNLAFDIINQPSLSNASSRQDDH